MRYASLISGDTGLARAYLMYALYYLRNWGTSIAFASIKGAPLHPWRIYAENGMTPKEVENLYLTKASKKKAMRVTILTGPYMKKLERPMAIIDIDNPPIKTKEEKLELMKTLARNGYTVVNTPRGLHIHTFLQKNENLPYIITVTRMDEDKEKTIGEGGVLHPHPWTSPPSQRNLGENRWFVYGFVLPDGRMFSNYDINKLKEIEPPTVSVSDLIDDVELYLSAKVRTYAPMVAPGAKLPRDSEEETAHKHPIFYNLEEFNAYVGEMVLPRCVAWVIYHYVNDGLGDELAASRLLAMYLNEEELMNKVPYGKRFLVAATTALFLSHVIEFIRFDEILEVLSYGIEGWPSDDGGNLEQKLKYLFYSDQDGFVYPRYSGLGAISPLPVLGEEFCSDLCPLSRRCKARSPWRAFKGFFTKFQVSKRVYAYDEPMVEEEV